MQFGATDFTFANAGRPDRPSNVIYFFAANGGFLSNPDLVRLHGFDPRDTYSYYCKIEMNFADVPTTDEAVKQASKFMSAALPDIMSCLPDWVDVTQGKYPPEIQSLRMRGSRIPRIETAREIFRDNFNPDSDLIRFHASRPRQ